jgi:hypothetical protein
MLRGKKGLAVIVTLVAALGGFSASALVGAKLQAPHQHHRASATWKEVYPSIAELVDRVDAIVVAMAVATSPGRLAYSDDGQDSLPFEEVEFSVVQGLKGLATGERFILERVGGIDAQGDSIQVDMDGGPFQRGDTYLLFLKRQEEGPYYLQVNDQGRFHVVRGRMRAVNPQDAVAAAFHGRSVEEGITLMRERAEGR